MKALLIPEARMMFLASSTLAPSTKFWLVNSTEECWSELGQSEAALNEFEATLAKEPNRFRTLYGAARSALLAGNPVKARIYNQQLVEICRNADADRPELREARQELATTEGLNTSHLAKLEFAFVYKSLCYIKRCIHIVYA
jgi:tetratricopeptide (TPR) repeat protein